MAFGEMRCQSGHHPNPEFGDMGEHHVVGGKLRFNKCDL